MVDRMLAAEGLIESHSRFIAGQLTDERDGELSYLTRKFGHASIYRYFRIPGSEIRSSKKIAQETGNLGLILIDYCSWLQGLENRQQGVSEISRQLKILAKN